MLGFCSAGDHAMQALYQLSYITKSVWENTIQFTALKKEPGEPGQVA